MKLIRELYYIKLLDKVVFGLKYTWSNPFNSCSSALLNASWIEIHNLETQKISEHDVNKNEYENVFTRIVCLEGTRINLNEKYGRVIHSTRKV